MQSLILMMALTIPCDLTFDEPCDVVLLQEDCNPEFDDLVDLALDQVDSTPLEPSLLCGCTPPCPEDCPCSCHKKTTELTNLPVLAGVAIEPFYDHPAATFATYPINLRTPRYTPSRGFIGGFGGSWGGGGSSSSTPCNCPVVPEPTAVILFVIGACGLYWIAKNEAIRRNRQRDVQGS